jgi:DNA-binding GntR family transcriptional regulator
MPLSSIVLSEIREAIVRGELAPGEVINQVELSRRFGVSRAPLREALRQLENDGLVTNVAYRGTIVAPLTARSIRELLAVRQLFETYAARQIISGADTKAIEDLEAIVEEMQRSADAGDLDGLNAADVAFHTRIVRSSTNRLMGDIWDRYVPLIRRTLMLRNRANQDLASLIQLHRDLVNALKSGDVEQLTNAYAMHGTDIIAVLEPLLETDESD